MDRRLPSPASRLESTPPTGVRLLADGPSCILSVAKDEKDTHQHSGDQEDDDAADCQDRLSQVPIVRSGRLWSVALEGGAPTEIPFTAHVHRGPGGLQLGNSRRSTIAVV